MEAVEPDRAARCRVHHAQPRHWALRERKWLDGAHIVGCVSASIELLERLFCKQLFCVRVLGVHDSPPEVALTVAPPT